MLLNLSKADKVTFAEHGHALNSPETPETLVREHEGMWENPWEDRDGHDVFNEVIHHPNDWMHPEGIIRLHPEPLKMSLNDIFTACEGA